MGNDEAQYNGIMAFGNAGIYAELVAMVARPAYEVGTSSLGQPRSEVVVRCHSGVSRSSRQGRAGRRCERVGVRQS